MSVRRCNCSKPSWVSKARRGQALTVFVLDFVKDKSDDVVLEWQGADIGNFEGVAVGLAT